MAAPTRQNYINQFTGRLDHPIIPTIQQLQTFWNNNLNRELNLRFEIDSRDSDNFTALLRYAGSLIVSHIPHLIFLLQNGASFNATRNNNDGSENTALFWACSGDNRSHIIFFLHLGIEIHTRTEYNRIITIRNSTDAQITSYIQQINNYIVIPGNAMADKILYIRNLIQEKIALYEQQLVEQQLQQMNNMQVGKKYLKYKAKYLQLKNQLN